MLPPASSATSSFTLPHSFIPPCKKEGGRFFRTFGIKGWVTKILELRGRKFELQNFKIEVVFPYIIEKMHTPDQKVQFKIFFACSRQLSCNSHLKRADITLLGIGIWAKFWKFVGVLENFRIKRRGDRISGFQNF